MNNIVQISDDLLPDADVAGHSEIGNFEGTIGDFGVLTLRSGYFFALSPNRNCSLWTEQNFGVSKIRPRVLPAV